MEQNSKQPGNSGMWKLWAVIAVCAAPLAASYFTYYVIKPGPSTNYGALIDPRAYPMPALATTTLDGKPERLTAYKSKWIMLHVDRSSCEEYCKKKMHDLRQLRLAQGKEMDRIERVWLITDNQPLDIMLMREYDGTRMLRANFEQLRAWLPVESSTSLADHIYMIDPLGNLMMRFPANADANKIKRDVAKLLKASRIG